MKLDERGKLFIKQWESFKFESYQDEAGVWTIGWGTTRVNGIPVSKGMVINRTMGDALFDGDVLSSINCVERVVSVNITQNQFNALVSLCYNIGCGGFSGSTLLKMLNGKIAIIEDLFARWNKITVNGKLQVSAGLAARRKAEYAMFREK